MADKPGKNIPVRPNAPKFPRPIAGTDVYIIGGPLGKLGVRIVDKRGNDITDEKYKAIRAILQESSELIGKVALSDLLGEELPLIKTLQSGISLASPVRVETKTVSVPTNPVQIKGITPADALDVDDVMGNITIVKVPKSGVIYSATLWDIDDEGLQIDLEIFKENIVQIANDAAWDPSDSDILHFITEVAFVSFDDHISSQTSEVTNIGKAYTAPKGKLFIQAVARGASNIAAGKAPLFQLQILSDDPDWKP